MRTRTALTRVVAARIDEYLVQWAMQKFKGLRAGPPGRGGGWTPLDGASPPCPRTGTCCHTPQAGLCEPYDGRPSRTVLRGREGEAPSRSSPGMRFRSQADRCPGGTLDHLLARPVLIQAGGSIGRLGGVGI